MNIAGIDYESVKDGDGVRTTIYVSGCSHNCYNCHNPQTHDVNYGVPFTEKLQNEIIENIKKRPFISGITWSGGDPLHENCLDDVLKFTNKIRLSLPEKTIWLYTGYKWMVDISQSHRKGEIVFNIMPNVLFGTVLPNDEYYRQYNNDQKRLKIISMCDVLVDGQYIDSKRDVSLRWRGSSNQRVVDIKETLKRNKIVLYCE